MASFYLADQCCELLLFLLALKELSNRSASACVCHVGQLADAIVQLFVRANHEGVLVHCFIATAYSEKYRIQNYIKHP